MKALVGVIAAVACASRGFAQSLNIDFGVTGNNVVPSAAYGGAANQPGLWNAVGPNSPIRDVDGNITTVAFSRSGGGTFQSSIAGANADEQSLMSDVVHGAVLIGDERAAIAFAGLMPGKYRLYVYGWNPEAGTMPIGRYRMWDDEQVQLNFTSTWPGQQVLNQTYFTKDFTVTSTSQFFDIIMVGLGTDAVPRVSVVNGIQIVMIPAPGAGAGAAAVVLGLAAARRRRR